MTHWVRLNAGGDIRLSYVVRAARDPLLHQQLSRIPVRGGSAAVLREALNRLAASGELASIIDEFIASRPALCNADGTGHPGTPAAAGGVAEAAPAAANPRPLPSPLASARRQPEAPLDAQTAARLHSLGGQFLKS